MNRRRFLRNSLTTLALVPLGRSFLSARPLPYPGGLGEAFEGAPVLESLLAKASADNWQQQSIGNLVATIGLELRGTPYVAGTLEIDDDREVCSANLLGLDCVTFFETALGVARMIKAGDSGPTDLLAELTLMRYRGGKLTDYASRLHYTSDWFADNARKGLVDVVTRSLPGAEKYGKKIDFMSTHVSAYRQLSEEPILVDEIKAVERRLNESARYYVPKAKVSRAESELHSGDIVAITTSIAGLDVSHTGLCYRDESGTLRLLHASLTHKKVVLDMELSKYLAGNGKQTGIMVARPLEPITVPSGN